MDYTFLVRQAKWRQKWSLKESEILSANQIAQFLKQLYLKNDGVDHSDILHVDKDSRQVNQLTSNVPDHIETNLQCKSIDWFLDDEGTLFVNGLMMIWKLWS